MLWLTDFFEDVLSHLHFESGQDRRLVEGKLSQTYRILDFDQNFVVGWGEFLSGADE